MDLPPLVEQDLADVLSILRAAGFEPKSCIFTPACFGNFLVCFSGGKSGLDIARDRDQYFLGGNHPLLKNIGFWRALTRQELVDGVENFLAAA